MRPLRQTSGRPPEEIRKGELKKLALENILEKEDARLEKIEAKTNKLLLKAEQINEPKLPISYPSLTTQLPVNCQSTTTQNKRSVSFLTFQSMPSRKIPRQILNHVRQNAFMNEGAWYSKIDSYELAMATGKSPRDLQLAVKRLFEEGWFRIIETSTSGYRILKIKPEEYGLLN
jgi:hypothetical protein